MRLSTRGTSIIECLVALTVFALGALGSAATMALATRLAGEARRATAAGRALNGGYDQLLLDVLVAAGRCPTVGATSPGLHGSVVQWQGQPVTGGLALQYIVTFPTTRGLHADTGQGYVACR